jgi:hypothetical protein
MNLKKRVEVMREDWAAAGAFVAGLSLAGSAARAAQALVVGRDKGVDDDADARNELRLWWNKNGGEALAKKLGLSAPHWKMWSDRDYKRARKHVAKASR